MRVLGPGSEQEMVACFLRGELASERFGAAVRDALRLAGESELLLTDPDTTDPVANRVRAGLLGATRGYRLGRDVFDETFPDAVVWVWAELNPDDLRRVRYIEYSYWNELTGGTRLPVDAARRIRAGARACDVSNDRFLAAADDLAHGHCFAPLILVGPHLSSLVCLEGNLRLTAYALGGFPSPVKCLIGTAPAMDRWCK